MKRRWMHLIAGLTMFALCISVCTTTANATVIWEDDFDDGNYDGWTICDNSTLAEPGWNGSDWSADNHYLQIEAGDGEAGWGIISHPSNVAYGTWSFDFKTNETQIVATGVLGSLYFISTNIYDWNNRFTDSNYYTLAFDAIYTAEGYELRLRLFKRVDGVGTTIGGSEDHFPIAGWHHINVTRTTAGLFSVYHNGSLMVQGEDTDHTTSVMFWLWFAYESMIDNIVVDDEPITTTTTTTTTTTPTTTTNGGTTPPPIDPLLIGLFGGIGVGVVLIAIVYLRRR